MMDDAFGGVGDEDEMMHLGDEEGNSDMDGAGDIMHHGGGRTPGGDQSYARRRSRIARAIGSFTYNDSMPPAVDAAKLFPCSDATIRPQVCAVIADVKLGRDLPIDLAKFATSVRDVELHPSRKAAVLRLREPRCCLTVRQCGTITLTGCKSLAAAKAAASIGCKVVRKAMDWTAEQLHTVTFTLHTSTVRFDLKHPIRLESLAAKHPQQVSYEPDSFCAANVRLTGIYEEKPGVHQRWAVTAAVFSSGKVVMMGAISAPEVTAAYNGLLAILHPFSEVVHKTALQPNVAAAVAASKVKKDGDDDEEDDPFAMAGKMLQEQQEVIATTQDAADEKKKKKPSAKGKKAKAATKKASAKKAEPASNQEDDDEEPLEF